MFITFFVLAAVGLFYTVKEIKHNKQIADKRTIIQSYLLSLPKVNDLHKLFQMHKQLAKEGLTNNPSLCPDKYGVFRTQHIETMDEHEVYLGNIYGLFTLPLPQWVGSEEEPIIVNQYKRLIESGLLKELNKL